MIDFPTQVKLKLGSNLGSSNSTNDAHEPHVHNLPHSKSIQQAHSMVLLKLGPARSSDLWGHTFTYHYGSSIPLDCSNVQSSAILGSIF